MMRVITVKDYDAMSKKAANLLAAQITLNPSSVLGLATGSTPIGTYQYLIQKYEVDQLDFREVKVFNLDEYCGLPMTHEQSYAYFMKQHLFSYVNITEEYTFIPDGMNENAQAVCEAYDKQISQAGGIDLQLLGMGHNGHVGFNEPSDEYQKNTHCIALQPSTIAANQIYFNAPDEMPKYAYTMGIGSIMKSKKILLIVTGKEKAAILKEALYGAITPQVPASILQLHPNVTVIADTAASSLLI